MTTLIKIYSANNDYQRIETLRRNRLKRSREGEFFFEGVRAINQALSNRWEITALVYSREKRLSDWAEEVLVEARAKIHYELPLSLMKKLSQKEETSELIALAAMPGNDLARIPIRQDLLVLVLDRPTSPGNLGSIIRSGDALGAHGLIISGHAVDLYDPETIQATTGSFFSLPCVALPSHNELIPWLERLRQSLPELQVLGTSAKASQPIYTHDLTRPTIFLVGNETRGLSENYRALCDQILTIPMSGSASSLNAACAATLLLYETARQRHSQSRALR